MSATLAPEGGWLREEFPQLASSVYLNSCSAGLAPRAIDEVLARYGATLHAFRDEVWERWWADLQRYADRVAAFLGAAPGSVVTDGNVSTLLGRLATAFDFRSPRRRVVTTDLEFPSSRFLWESFARLGAELVVVHSHDGITVDADAIARAIDARTALVSLSHATYATGALLDVPRVAAAAHRHGALVAVDAYASFGVVPIDVDALDVDFLLGGAHKWMCGSYESAFLYVRPSLSADLVPAATGWIAGEDPLSFGRVTRHAKGARRFASGTPAVLPVLLSEVGHALVERLGIANIRARSLRATARILDFADAHGLEVRTPREPEARGGIVALRFSGDAAATRALVARGFVCSHRGALRVAPHFYNHDDDIDAFLRALVEVRREIGS